MRWYALLLLATSAACGSSDNTHSQDDANVPVDACPLPNVAAGCVPDGFATVNPDGAWHMTGTTTTSVYGDLDPNTPPTVTMTAVDQQVFIQRYGCTAGFGSAAMPPPNPQTAVNMTAISLACDHSTGCARGSLHWSICAHGDGTLAYEEQSYSTSTMPGAYETMSTTSAVLTR